MFVYVFFFFNDTATTEIYTYDTLFPYTTLFRSSGRQDAGADRGPQFDDGDSDRSRAAFYRQGCGRDREWRPDVALDAGSPGDRRRAVVEIGRASCRERVCQYV